MAQRYLTIVATSVLVPLEIFEIVRHATAIRVGMSYGPSAAEMLSICATYIMKILKGASSIDTHLTEEDDHTLRRRNRLQRSVSAQAPVPPVARTHSGGRRIG